jgi:plasmid stability protein
MATITITDVPDNVMADLRREAERRGTTVETVAADRILSALASDDERVRDEWHRRLLDRIRSGESIDGDLGRELRRARDAGGVGMTDEWLCAARDEGRP